MLNTHQQVEFLIAGLYAKGSAVPKLADDEATTLAHHAYHDEVSLEDLSSGHEIIDVVVGRWAKTGDLKFIAELVRFAKHRNGSTASLGDSLYAMDLLNAAVIADPAFKPILRNFGYDAQKPTHGDFPNGLTAEHFKAPVFVDHPINSEAEGAQFAAANSARAVDIDIFATAVNCRADRDAVVLDFAHVDDNDVTQGGAIRIGLGLAADLLADLGQLVDELTLPAPEGYAWLDAEDGMSSILRAEGRKTAALFADKTRFPGTRETREIGSTQHEGSEFTNEPFACAFGNDELARSCDLITSKFTVAQRVREYLAELSAA